jgi:hypothetical protein
MRTAIWRSIRLTAAALVAGGVRSDDVYPLVVIVTDR